MKNVLFLFIVFLSGYSFTQCSDPISITTSTFVNAFCPGEGKIEVTKMSPNILPAGNYYQYSLFNTSLNVEIYSWQNSNTFLNLDAGVYEIRVRKVCALSPFISAGYVIKAVTINNTQVAPSISNIKLLRRDKCTNGSFDVTAVGSGPLQYALVSSISEGEPVSTYIRGPQSSKQFNDLAAGTYYVRVYNVCGSAVTQEVIIESETSVSSVSHVQFSFLPNGCDSLGFGFNMINYTRSLPYFPSDDKVKAWIKWPNGITDSMVAINQNINAQIQTVRSHFFSTNLINIDPTFNPSLPWPSNLNVSSFTIEYGFLDACGVSYSNTFTYNKTTLTNLVVYSEDNDPRTDCDSLTYSFAINYSGGTGSVSSNHGFAAHSGVEFSLDGGTTWINAFSLSGFPALSNDQTKSVRFVVLRGSTVNLLVRYCGINTLNKSFTAESLEALTTTFEGASEEACLNRGKLRIRKLNANGDKVGVEMISSPVGQALIPYFVSNVLNTGISYTDIPQYNDILPGQYKIKVWDTIGVACYRMREVTVNVVAFTFDFSYNILCNGNIEILTNKALGANPGNTTVKLFNSIGGQVFGGVNGLAGTTQSTAVVPGAAINSLPAGVYKIRVGRYLGNGLDNCSYVEKDWIKTATSTLTLQNSVFISGCTNGFGTISAVANGGKSPYTITLLDAGNNLVSQTTPNIYDNLNSSQVYKLSVIDVCGAIVDRLIASNLSPDINVPGYANMPCVGDNITLAIPNYPQGTFVWTKNNILLPSETSSVINLTNIQIADSGVYSSTITVGQCIINKSLLIDPNSCNGPLAVTLTSFTAYCDPTGNIDLNWKTASEMNTMDFILQKSENLIDWETIEIQSSKGNSSVMNLYSSIDRKPFENVTYYQLIQRDFNGVEKKYSPISNNCDFGNENRFNLYPNPSDGDFKIEFISEKKSNVTLQIVDVEGRMISSQTYQTELGNNTLFISENLVKGVYIIRIETHEKEMSPIKLVVN